MPWIDGTEHHCTTLFNEAAALRVVQLLADHKADIAASSKSGKTALHCALEKGADLEVVQCLIDHGADVNATDASGRTPLHRSARKGVSGPVMDLLLAQNVDVRAKDRNLQKLMYALVRSNSAAAVAVLFGHLRSNYGPGIMASVGMCDNKERNDVPYVHHVRGPGMAKLLMEPNLSKNNRVIPWVLCREMLFAKDGAGESLLDLQCRKGALFQYLASYTDLPLTVARISAGPSTHCEHRDKRKRNADGVAVIINPMLNKFQYTIAEEFLSKWNGSLTVFQPKSQTRSSAIPSFLQCNDIRQSSLVEHGQGLHFWFPAELQYAIMSYLSPADIVRILAA